MIALDLELEQILSQPTCIVGVGNLLRNDDAVGAMIAGRLEEELLDSSGHCVVNAEDVIENYVFQIADRNVRNVLVIDAVQGSGSEPGSLILGKLEDLEVGGGFSTHKLALSMAASVLKQHGKDVYLLGIAVTDIEFGTTVRQEILDSAETVIDLILGRIVRSN